MSAALISAGRAGQATSSAASIKLAWEQIHANIDLLEARAELPRAGRERLGKCRRAVQGQRYSVVVHGVGLCDEYPACYYTEDWSRDGYDGRL